MIDEMIGILTDTLIGDDGEMIGVMTEGMIDEMNDERIDTQTGESHDEGPRHRRCHRHILLRRQPKQLR